MRSWTRGYDIYLPKQIVSWHYSASQKSDASPHHWNVIEDKIASPLSSYALEKLGQLVRNEIAGEYGLGNARTVQDWIEFSGVDFFNKTFNERKFND